MHSWWLRYFTVRQFWVKMVLIWTPALFYTLDGLEGTDSIWPELSALTWVSSRWLDNRSNAAPPKVLKFCRPVQGGWWGHLAISICLYDCRDYLVDYIIYKCWMKWGVISYNYKCSGNLFMIWNYIIIGIIDIFCGEIG